MGTLHRAATTRFALAASCTLAACATSNERGQEALPQDLARVLRDYEAAWQAKDPIGLAALFTEDGWVMSNGRPPVHGRDAIAKRYANSGGPLALRSLHWERRGNLAIILGAYARAPGDPDLGKFTLTLRRDSAGSWRILSDMDNGNSRP